MSGSTATTRVRVAATLALVMTVPSLTQFALGSLAPFLTAEFDLSRSGLGAITSAYYLAAAGLSPLMGRFVDLTGVRRSMVATVLIGWAGSLAFASSGNVAAAVGSVVVAGAATALANPTTNAAISALPRPHATLVGVKQSGVQTAALIAGSTLPVLAVAHGWRVAVAACSAAFAVGLLAAATTRVTSRAHADGDAASRPATSSGTRRLALFAGLMGCGMAAVNVYLVLFAHDRLDLDVRLAGATLATIGLVAIVARITCTQVVERSTTPDRTGVLMLRAMAAAGVGATVLIAAAPSLGHAALWVAAVTAGASVAAFNGVAMLVVIRTNHAPARASGLVQGCFFAGMLVSPPVFGLLVDATGDYTYGWLWAALCLTAATAVLPRPRKNTNVS